MRVATVCEHQGHRWSIEPIVPTDASCSQPTGNLGGHSPEQATTKQPTTMDNPYGYSEMDWAAQLDRYSKGEYQAMAFVYSARLDASLSFEMLMGPKATQPRKVWDNPEAQELLRQSMLTTDTAKRQALFMALSDKVSAEDGSKAWDLRCAVREHLVEWVRTSYPQALPRMRTEWAGGASGAAAPPMLPVQQG
jgi:hypothetical protein